MNTMTYIKFALASAVVAISGLTPAHAQTPVNLIVNGSFEDGETGWTRLNSAANASGGIGYFASYPLDASPDGGQFWGTEVWTGKYAGTQVSALGISQVVTGLVVNQTYTLSFWATARDWVHENEGSYWQVTLNGDELLGSKHIHPVNSPDLKNFEYFTDGTLNSKNVAVYTAQQPWELSTITFKATATTETLAFRQINGDKNFADNTPQGTPTIMNIDGISLAAVPEPSTATLGLAGALLMGFVVAGRRSKSKR